MEQRINNGFNDRQAELYSFVRRIRDKKQTVQCITNFVTVNDCANILLAAGASPTMSESVFDAHETVMLAHGLVLNLGAIEKIEAMRKAGRRANELGKPVVLDPIGAGGGAVRKGMIAELMHDVRFTAIRGNASEIRSLALGEANAGGGVDVLETDKVTDKNLYEYISMIEQLAIRLGTVIAVSGEMDLVSDGKRTAIISNGCETMSRITGSGCMLTTLIGAFCAAAPEAAFDAVCAAMVTMGIAGELAEERRILNGTGNATFRNDLIDAVFNMTDEQFKERIRYEIYQK